MGGHWEVFGRYGWSLGSLSPVFGGLWKVFGRSLGGLWEVFEVFGRSLKVFERSLGGLWEVFGKSLRGLWLKMNMVLWQLMKKDPWMFSCQPQSIIFKYELPSDHFYILHLGRQRCFKSCNCCCCHFVVIVIYYNF